MRILILANNDGGLYKFRKELLETLVKEHDVFFCVPNGESVEKIISIGCKFVECTLMQRRGTNPVKDLRLMRFYQKVLGNIKPDVVLTYTIKPNVYGGIVCRQKGIPYIANVTGLGTSIENGGVLSKIATKLYKIGLKGANCVFFQNKANQKYFTDHKLVKGKTKLIPGSGVNLAAYPFKEYPPDSNIIRFLFVGRVMKDKGIEELLQAIRLVRQEAENANVHVDIVGGCEEDYLEKLHIAEAEGDITYHGSQPDVHPFYENCHCVVLPSYHEGTSNVLLEASSTGRPVITTRVPGCQEVFDEGITGFGCDVRSAESLAAAMKLFIKLPQEKCIAIGKAAREKMKREYDRNIVIDAYKKEINSLVK